MGGRRGTAEAKAQAIFREIAPPASHANSPINKFATWHTWSPTFRSFLAQAAAELGRLSAPPVCRIKRLKTYDQTFSWPLDRWVDADLRRRFISFARSLNTVRPGRKIMLFDGMMGPQLDSKRLHALFALLRGALKDFAGDERAAMYSALGEVGKTAGDFPLHADLYISTMLFNIFDDVAPDDSGASTFLPVSALRKIIPRVSSLPPRQGKRIMGMFEDGSPKDRFDMLYDLLHGPHPWVKTLEAAMQERQVRIKLQSGQGYLLHDRLWLHGRDNPRDGVARDRLRRLVFGWKRTKSQNLPSARLARRQPGRPANSRLAT
jgi:hypothetical protein